MDFKFIAATGKPTIRRFCMYFKWGKRLECPAELNVHSKIKRFQTLLQLCWNHMVFLEEKRGGRERERQRRVEYV